MNNWVSLQSMRHKHPLKLATMNFFNCFNLIDCFLEGFVYVSVEGHIRSYVTDLEFDTILEF